MTKNFFLVSIALVSFSISFVNVEASFLLVLFLLFAWTILTYPEYGLLLLIVLSPFAYTTLLGQNLGGIPGFKIPNLLPLFVMTAFILRRTESKLTLSEMAFFLAVLAVHSLSVLRSLSYYRLVDEASSMLSYINSYLIKPGIYLLPLFIIAAYVRERRNIRLLSGAVVKTSTVLSVVILALTLFNATGLVHYNVMKNEIAGFFHMHTNNLADFYILGFPLLLASFLNRKSAFNGLNLVLALASIMVLYSRTAYLLIAFSTLVFLVMNKSKKWIPLMVALGVVTVLCLPYTSSVVERAEYGMQEGNLNTLLSGRLERGWLPIFALIKKDPSMVLAGQGFSSVVLSRDIDLGHAHNMYLEAMLDVGLVGIAVYLMFYVWFLKNLFQGYVHGVRDRESRNILLAILISILAYLLSGITGRHLFPDISNFLLWVLLGLGIAICKTEMGRPHEA